MAQGQELALLRAVFLLAYHASLRVSEYAVSPADHTLKLEDLSFVIAAEKPLKAVIKLPSFKASKRPTKLLLSPSSDASLCPVMALLKYSAGRQSQHRELFVRPSQRGQTPLTTSWINSKIAGCAQVAQLEPGQYSSHSFRAGLHHRFGSPQLLRRHLEEVGEMEVTSLFTVCQI